MEKIGFVVKGKGGLYMGIDQSSGGYAYLTPYFSSARFFKTEDEATQEGNYWNARPNYGVVECRAVPVLVGV